MRTGPWGALWRGITDVLRAVDGWKQPAEVEQMPQPASGALLRALPCMYFDGSVRHGVLCLLNGSKGFVVTHEKTLSLYRSKCCCLDGTLELR